MTKVILYVMTHRTPENEAWVEAKENTPKPTPKKKAQKKEDQNAKKSTKK